MMNYPHLAQRLFNTPLAITPTKAEVIMAALADRLGVTHLFNGSTLTPRAFDQEDEGGYYGEKAAAERDRGYDLVEGIAVIPVTGTLVQKLGSLRPYSGMTGYDGIRAAFSMAVEDPAVKAIVLDVDSPGGEVAGCLDLVDEIYGARGIKPMASILSECAYSAAFALATATDPGRLYVPRTGGTGSVGVICMHVDWSQALGKMGVQVTFITYGERKADGHPEIPLSPEALKRFQADVDTTGELFVETVARNRGISAAAVRATQATTFQGAAGVQVGFADFCMAPADAFATVRAALG
ncbi:MAG: S49 family peptidase [Caulobacteraceae bacterium]